MPAAIASLSDEEHLHEFIEKHGENNITELKVHAVLRPDARMKRPTNLTFDSWTIHKDGKERFQYDVKEDAKEKARKMAEENTPAVIAFEDREGEVFRGEVVE